MLLNILSTVQKGMDHYDMEERLALVYLVYPIATNFHKL